MSLMKPEILAPAGDTSSALAALAAGADALYLGLKHFSARMQAENFSTTELSRLVDLANQHDARVYVAMNTLLKPDDMDSAYRLAARLARDAQPHGLIVQDLGMVDLARQAGFQGGIFLSTLANITHPAGLQVALDAGASRVILPRELSIDEIRAMGEACPDGLDLECFVHGALCYCVSGRCYWSSYMGGKSGLRGRCVQPCRRVYRQGGNAVPPPPRDEEKPRYADSKGRAQDRHRQTRQDRPRTTGKLHSGRYFSCLDLSLDVLAKTLLDVPHLTSWKIEGRKKGPHYVYHVVTAYRMLRDNPSDPQARKMAEDILGMALGRPGSHARFLPQRALTPTAPNDQTSSGLLIGKVALDGDKPFIKPYIELLSQDYLRVGVEDQTWHATLPVTRRTPKAGTLPLRLPKHKTPKAGTPVYLIDRRQPELMDLLKQWQAKLDSCKGRPSGAVNSCPELPTPARPRKRPDMFLRSAIPQGRETRGAKHSHMALWLSPKAQEVSRTIVPRMAWWLPPVIWPEEEAGMRRLVHHMMRNGATHFVCNAPWQMAFFQNLETPERFGELDILAGPFCNVANAAHIAQLERMGFAGAFVCPELPAADLLALPAQSSLPLGFVLDGFWPVAIARFSLLGIKPNEPFASPKGEVFWARNYGGNVWIYPGWPLNFTEKRAELEKAGYSFFLHVDETPPASLPEVRRHGLFNWDEELL